jgi:hypothetical protein
MKLGALANRKFIGDRAICGDRLLKESDKRSVLIFWIGDREVKKLMGNWGDRYFLRISCPDYRNIVSIKH